MHESTPTPRDFRRRLVQAFDALPIFARSVESALYNCCAVMEVNSYLAGASKKAIYSANRETVEACIRDAVDSDGHMVMPLLSTCPASSEPGPGCSPRILCSES